MRYFNFLLLLIISLSTANAQIINDIRIVGNNVIDKDTILVTVPFKVGEFYGEQHKTSITQKLMNTGFFQDIVITDTEDILTIKVKENPIIKEIKVDITDNNLLKKSDVTENLARVGVSPGAIYNDSKLTNMINQLQQQYILSGYANAKVDWSTEIDQDNLMTIVINIVENLVTKIKTINITGNYAFTEEVLLNLFTLGEADIAIVNYFTKKDHYSQIKLNDSLEKVKNLYLNNGYLDFSINNVDIVEEGEKIVINIDVSEGTQYTIGSINFTGADEYVSSENILNTNDIFNRQQVADFVQIITDDFADLGYAFIQVSTDVIKKNDKVDLFINIVKNQKVYINRIIISGNIRTSDSVVRREISLLEGSLYNNSELAESITRIRRLGFFQDVKMRVAKVTGSADKIDLYFEVVEDRTGSFSIGLGHSNKTGVSFNFGVRERNIFGSGNTLNAKLSVSDAVKNIDFSFLNPYFNNKGHSISYGIFNREVDGSELESSEYIIDKTGISFGYGVPLTDRFRLKFDARVSNINVSCGEVFTTKDYEQEQCEKDLSSELLTSVALSNNSLNNFRFPTDGTFYRIKLSVALPIFDYSYYKLDTDYDNYTDLGDNITLKLGLKTGLGSGISGEELPFFERYYGGGASSIRGFDFNSLGSKYPDDTVRGGGFTFVTNASLIMPLPGVEDSANMRVAAFLDFGGVYDEFSDVSLSDAKASVGVAFLWATAVGPLGVYAAIPIKEKDGDDIKHFDFTLGSTF